jgi:hypothetical protein
VDGHDPEWAGFAEVKPAGVDGFPCGVEGIDEAMAIHGDFRGQSVAGKRRTFHAGAEAVSGDIEPPQDRLRRSNHGQRK